MFEDVLTNSGPFFSAAHLAKVQDSPKWACDEAAEVARTLIREAFEKHDELLHENCTEPQTKFFAVNPVLHALGYVYSIDEMVTIQHDAQARVDYSLFPDSERFQEVEPLRGGPAFFRTALGLVQATVWGEPLDLSDDSEAAAQQPIVLIDLLLRSSGVNFGFVTNGQKWRLVHRGSSDRFDHYAELEVKRAIEGTLDEFKLFYLLFGRDSLRRDDDGLCFIDRLLED